MADEIATVRLAPADAGERLAAEIGRWPWVQLAPGSTPDITELWTRGRLFGHVLRYWSGHAAVGLALSAASAACAASAGEARLHPLIADGKWVLIVLHTIEDIGRATTLARAAYAEIVPPLRLVQCP